MGTFVGMALVGFADDFIKLRMGRNLGLNKTTKFLGQALIAACSPSSGRPPGCPRTSRWSAGSRSSCPPGRSSCGSSCC
jgi:UDP-N-acetylmuramyl pentapeptide phosphotransferase/UDP-N-acetylglucosamine-1-phosphate transferase